MAINVVRKETSAKFFGLVVNKNVFLSTIAVIILSLAFTLIFRKKPIIISV